MRDIIKIWEIKSDTYKLIRKIKINEKKYTINKILTIDDKLYLSCAAYI